MKRVPKLRKHSAGQAYFILTAAGRTHRHSVGRFGTSEAETAYHRLIAERESSGRAVQLNQEGNPSSGDAFTVGHMVLAS
jgi:hypothetical protein